MNIETKLKQSVAFHRTGNLEMAEAGYRSILEINPAHPDALHLMGMIASQKGDFTSAVRLIREAIQQFPVSDIFYNNLGNALARMHRIEEAIDAYREALRIKPESVEAINNLATNLKESGRIHEALGYFEQALAIKPQAAELYNNMGNALTDVGRLDEALACFRKAIALKPDYAIAYNNLGSALKLQLCFKQALDSYSHALQADPDYAEAYNNLGETLADSGHPDEALVFFNKAIALKPGFGLAAGNLRYALTRICQWDRLAELDHVLDRDSNAAISEGRRPSEDPFLNLVRHDDPAWNYKVAAAWSDAIVKRVAPFTSGFDFASRNGNQGKVIVGYLADNFHDHPTTHLITRLLALHDRNRFEVYCFSSGLDDGSDHRQHVVRNCDRFVDIRHLDHAAAAKCIHDARVDILVDLMGHTKGSRLEISAQRPAPIQVRYLGMAGTTGAVFFDYLIADAVVIPESHFPYYSENIVHMPNCYQVNDEKQVSASQQLQRTDVGLPEQGFVFCSFNQPYKIDAAVYGAWIRILQSVPGSVLWLQGSNAAAEENLRQVAQRLHIDEDRIVFAERVSKPQHLRRLELADLALDTRMVSGAATTSDALWAGVPVLALKGNHFASRMSASILGAVGLPQLVARSLAEYENMAIDLAMHADNLNDLRRQLFRNQKTMPLFDTALFTRHLESAYLQMWRRFLDGQHPRPFRVNRETRHEDA